MGRSRAAALAAILVLPTVLSGWFLAAPSASNVPPDPIAELNTKGMRLRHFGEHREAEKAFREALQLAEGRKDRAGAGTAWNNLGVLYTVEAKPGQALEALSKALRIRKDLGDPEEEATTLLNQGAAYTVLGRLSEALVPLESSLEIRKRLEDHKGQASTLTAIAWVRTLQGQPEEALRLFDQALGLQQDARDEEGRAGTLDRRGTALAEMGHMADAAASYRESLKISQSLDRAVWVAHTRANLGQLYVKTGDPRKGEWHLLQALPRLSDSGDRNAEAHTLLWLAHAARRMGKPALALERIEESLALVGAIRGEVPGTGLRTSYAAQRYGYQELWIDTLMQLHALRPGEGFDLRALEASDKSRSRGLLEVRREEGAVRPHEELPRLQAGIRKLDSTLALPLPQERAGKVRQKMDALLLERGRLRSAPPAVEESQEAPGLQELGKLLGKDTVLLEYAVGEERTFLWMMDAAGVETRVLPGRAVLEQQVGDALKILSSGYRRNIARAPEAAANLGKALLGPAAGRLGGKRVLIVPDGVLHKVPFAALPVHPGAPPLLANHEIVLAPSASTVAFLRSELAHRGPAPELLALLADPVYGAEDGRLGRFRVPLPPGRRPRWARLTATRAEARSILGMLPKGTKRSFVADFDANRAKVLDGGLSDYRILHFATHAEIDEEHPDLSSLVLSLVDAKGQPREGYLRAFEIRDLKLSADLVVLSACSTGVGREMRGEGPLALSRAFLEAGAARVVVSLWDVEDGPTAELMGRFYKHYLEGVPAARALRQAQLSMSREPRWAAPYYWGGFVLQGEWR